MPDENTQTPRRPNHHHAEQFTPRGSESTVGQYRSHYKTFDWLALGRLNFYGHEGALPGEVSANAWDIVDHLEINSQDSSVDSFRLNKSLLLFRFSEVLKIIRPSEIPVLMAEIERVAA